MVLTERVQALLCDPGLDALPLTPERFRYKLEDEKVAASHAKLHELLDSIWDSISTAKLPQAVDKHPFYEALFKTRLAHEARAKNSFLKKDRNHARLISQRPNEERAQEFIAEFAANVLGQIRADGGLDLSPEQEGNAIRNTRRAVNALVRENLEAVAAAPIFFLGLRKKSGDETEIMVSTQRIKEAFKKIQGQVTEAELDRDDATVALLMELGAITQKEIVGKGARDGEFRLQKHDLSRWNDAISRSLQWAREQADKDLWWIGQLIRRYAGEGKLEKGRKKIPSLNNDLRNRSVFELLGKLFDQKTNFRDANDIQILLNLALAHWTHTRFYESVKPASFDRIKSIIWEKLFKTNEVTDMEGPMITFNPETGSFEEVVGSTEDQQVYRLKPMHCPKGRDIYMYSPDLQEKPLSSCVMKSWDDDRGAMTPNKLPDLYRTRFVLWGVSSNHVVEDGTLATAIEDCLEELIEPLGLRNVTRKPYAYGDRFVKWKIDGMTPEGIPVEVQILPHDTYLFDNDPHSALRYRAYAERRSIEHWRKLIPPSVSPLAHTALDLREAELREEVEMTEQAIAKFDHSMFDRFAD